MKLDAIFRRKILSWPEYRGLVSDIDAIQFMHSTALKSYKNILRREADELAINLATPSGVWLR